MSFEVK